MRGIEECSARKTYPQLPNHPICLVFAADAIMIWSILHEGVVVERGYLGVLTLRRPHQVREVFPAQKSQDPIDIASRDPLLHKHPVPAQVVNNSYY